MFWEWFAVIALLVCVCGLGLFLLIFKHKDFGRTQYENVSKITADQVQRQIERAGEIDIKAKPFIDLSARADKSNISPEKTTTTRSTSEDLKKIRETRNG